LYWFLLLFYYGSDTRPTSKNNLFPVLRLRALPVGRCRKVMMTMASSTNAATPPWCQHIKNCTALPSPSLGESFASKVGTRGNNSQQNHPPTVLREIPTRNSPLSPTAAVVDRHDDAIDRQPQVPRPSLLNPLTVHTSVSESLSSSTDDDNYVDRRLEEKIAKLMRRWPSPTIDGAPCNINGLVTSHSTSPPPPVNLPNHEHYDYEIHLDRIAEKIEQMRRRWPSTSAVIPTATTAPRPTMNESPVRSNFSGMHPMMTAAPTMQDTAHPATTATITFVELPKCRTIDGDDPDVTLFTAVQSLDNFLLKYPRPNDLDAPYQPSPNRRQLPSCHDRFAQQTQVLCTVQALLGELNNKLSRFIAAISGCKPYPIDMSKTFIPRTPCHIALTALIVPRFPTKSVRTSQHSIPAKPPFHHLHRNLTLNRTKANLRPP